MEYKIVSVKSQQDYIDRLNAFCIEAKLPVPKISTSIQDGKVYAKISGIFISQAIKANGQAWNNFLADL